MADKVSASGFAELDGLDDWRFMVGRIEAVFRAASFDEAGRFALRMAEEAETARHHPEIDLRFPGLVHVSLATHSAGGQLTQADIDLARTISSLAADAGVIAEPLTAQAAEVAIDAMDIDLVRPFWTAVLGYDEIPADEPDGQVVDIVDPLRIGPTFWFQQMDEPRPQRNRIHIDVTVPHDIAEERVAAAIAAGGTLLTDEYAKSFWVLADPEGNEACVCTWQDREN